MKNVKHDKPQGHLQSSSQSEPQWREEWVPLAAVIPHAPLQVRNKLDSAAIARYAEMTRAGKLPPPIKVARVKGLLYLLDGWHRMEAGALQTMKGLDGEEVLALMADMTEPQARWESAQANLGHGVPLRNREMRNVFRAFIKAKRHIKQDGNYMSYREMGEALGKPHRTIHEWTRRDFPHLARKLGGHDGGNPKAEAPTANVWSLEEEHRHEAARALQQLQQHGMALSDPRGRWVVLQELARVQALLQAAGAVEPEPEDF